MVRLLKVLILMAATYYFLLRPFLAKMTVAPEAHTMAAIVGAMVVLAIVTPFVIYK